MVSLMLYTLSPNRDCAVRKKNVIPDECEKSLHSISVSLKNYTICHFERSEKSYLELPSFGRDKDFFLRSKRQKIMIKQPPFEGGEGLMFLMNEKYA
jgi:hypothetical protein